ncbi:Prophage tail fibre N-terminal [Serratia liquefaciens]|uniref:prophage tail fiber N-terminal domain-containing protein n=1 Tax=Serratia liquefaciens TaxID=614 RepID=UPI0021775FF2|nr:prophage tail fiber N-terminal domain-containing protein [Serratia liquefaciens]CAI1871366.1 Prophage tail fibre N-terminal [Serratia liquefaciens]HDS8360251.1 prophage tail fiber N-terminal domain-containing protein [Serratia liquefaciens]
MAVLISGKLIGPNGDPRPGVTIMLTAVKTSSAVVHLAPSNSTTGTDGGYSLMVEVGTHNVMIEAHGRPFEKVGQITVYSDSKPGTLNDFLTTPGQDELTPAIVALVDDMRTAAAVYAEIASDAANRAKGSAENAQNTADANTYYITPQDPDGTIAGLAGTPEGKSFRVAQGMDSLTSFIYYRNVAGVAIPDASYPSAQALLQMLARVTWEEDILNAFLWEDTNGNSAVRIKQSGEFQAAYARLFKAVLDDVDLKTVSITPDADGVIIRVRDRAGRDCFRIMADGRVLFPPNLKVFNENDLVSNSVGSIKLGDGLEAVKTPTGVKIKVVGGGSGSGPLGKTASQYTGPKKLNDPESWGNRKLVLSAGSAMVEGMSGSPSVFGFWVISTERIPESLRINDAKFYSYWSTDHGSLGGVFLATSDSPEGPWAPHGRIYIDPSSQQTETPCVVWDRHTKNWRMFYHVQLAKYGPNDSLSAKGIQSTLSAYSDDGVNWTKDPYFIIDKWDQNVGDGHTGYFYVSETPDGYIARSALGGTGYGLTTVWYHRGGTLGGRLVNGHITNNWYSDYRDVGSNYEATYGTEYQGLRTIPFGLFGFTVNGVRMAVGQLWNRRSATEAATVSIVAGPVTADYKRFVGLPTVIWKPEEAWESQDVRMSNFFVDDDRVYIFLSMGVNVATGAGANKIGVISHVI